MNPLVIVILSFGLTTGLVYWVAEARAKPRRGLHLRLGLLGNRISPVPPLGRADEEVPRQDALPTLTRWLGGRGWDTHLRLSMLRADLRLRPAEWLAVCAGLSLAAALLGLLATHQLLGGVFLAFAGLASPLMVLQARQAARRKRFDAQLPDALMLMTASLRAGHSFFQAIQTVSEELPPPLSVEFAWAGGEARLGVPLDVALGRMVERVSSPDLDLVVTAILIQLPLGGNLAEVLDAIAETIRERVRVAGEIQTLTAEGRLSAIVLIALAPLTALLLYLRTPDYFQPLLQTSTGHWLIGSAVLGQIVGALIIRRMVTLDI